MKIDLLLHTILVKPDKIEEADEVIKRARAAGIQVQLDKREEKAIEYGTVVSVGPTAFKDYGRSPDILKGGDRICFVKYAGKEITQAGETYLIMNDADVLCIIREE
jgi:co-chaperonin GroES (HSP10)